MDCARFAHPPPQRTAANVRTPRTIGAEILGVDLNHDIDPVTAEQLREAFLEHKVLVFRAQHLSPDRHVKAVRIFGEPFDHPTALRHPDNRLVYPYRVEQTGKASHWHVGGTWRTPAFRIESLVYQEVAEVGGDTSGPTCSPPTTTCRSH